MLKKIYAAIISLSIIVIALTTSVYAWFSLTSINFIEDIEFEADGNDELTLSLDGETYSKSIPSDTIRQIYGLVPKLETVTTTNNIDFQNGPPYWDLSNRQKDYISLEIHFRLVSDLENEMNHQRYVYLADRIHIPYGDARPSGTYVTSRGITWMAPISYQGLNGFVEDGTVETYYAANALRIGVYNPDENINFIYDVSENPLHGYGLSFGANDYYRRVSPQILPELNPIDEGLMIYELTDFNPMQRDIAMDQRSLVSKLELISSVDGLTTYEGSATINIWLEGWDPDCIDAVIRDQMLIQLRFRAARYYEDLNI